ncbi:hypothetical protein AWZ03_015465, partial [Drosophila navojoa]
MPRTPQQATPPPPTPPPPTPPPPTPPETAMDADEEWRPIRLPGRPTLQRQTSEPAPPPPRRPVLQRQASVPEEGTAQWRELPRAEWPREVEEHATRMEAQGSGRTARIVWANGRKHRVRRA